jgi:pyochelin synthetase
MNTTALLAELSRQDIKVWADGDQLRYRALKGTVTPPLLSKLAEHKAELLILLSQHQTSNPVTPLPQIVSAPDQLYLPFPTTDVQQAYWIGRSPAFELGGIGNHGYIEVEAVDLDLDRALLILRRLIERHPMLRAVMLPDGRQHILEHVPPFQIEISDLTGLDQQEVNKRLEHVRDEMDHQVFQVEQWPIFAIRVSRLDQRRVKIHVSVESLFVDAWSTRILLRDFQQLYHEPETGLPPLDLLFRDYVLAEQQLQASELYRRSQDYWTNRLRDLPPAPDLPLAIDPGSLKHPHFVPHKAQLEAPVWQQLKARGARVGLTSSGTLLAAFAEVLATWSKFPRFCINLTIFNRLPLHEQVNNIVGDFTSLLLLAVDYSLPEFEQRAKRLQEQLWRDFEHHYYSGVRVLRGLARLQGSSTQAMMPVVFTSLLGQEIGATYPALWQETTYFVTQTPQVWLDHQVLEEAGNLVLYWHTAEALFPLGLIDEMFEAYIRLLHRLATDDTAWQSHSLELIPSPQLAQRALINATEAPVSDQLLHSMFLEQAVKQPDHLALISPRRSLTYQEVLNEATLLGHQLRQLGSRPNHLVAVVMEKGWEQVVGVLGILLSGAAYLPIDAKLPHERLTFLLEHGEVEVMLTQSWLDKTMQWPEGLKRLCVDELNMTEAPAELLDNRQGPDDLAYVIYTSGSTGVPKGVMIDHRGAVNTILDINHRFNVTCDDRMLALSALNFDLSVYDIFGVLAVGGTIVMPADDALRDPSAWLELLIQEQVTLWNTVPAFLEMLVDYIEMRPQALGHSCLRLALISGDWIPVSLPERFKKLVPEAEIISLGGATEASIWSILYPIHAVDPSWKSIPYGKPMRNQQFFVLNERLEPCPIWVPGQLYIGGIGLAKGYWRDEEKTQASFLLHPQTGERIYRTGDLGRYLPDGNIEFLGREDFQVKVGGHRVELGEVETALLEHSQVNKAVVTVIGERFEHKQLVAYVVPSQTTFDQIDDSQAHVYWETLVDHCHTCRQMLTEPMVDDAFLQGWQMLEQVLLQIVCKAFNDFGVFATPYEHYSVEELIRRCAIHPRYTKWIQRNLDWLVQHKYLQEHNGRFTCEKPWSVATIEEFRNAYQNAATRLADSTSLAPEWNNNIPLLPSRSIEDLKAMLTEELHSAEIYVSTEVRDAYHLFRYNNILIQMIVKEVIRLTPAGKKLRCLEIGAGFGTTTEYILPVLPPEQTEYVYTDISAYFLQESQEKFAHYAFVEYRLLDIEKNPSAQGCQAHDFDLVIAASVLHATKDIAETLAHIRSLLKPHGLLLLLEETHFHHIFDLTMGLQQGFDRFEDTDLRQSHPLLSRETWQQVFRGQGFASSAIFHEVGTLMDFLGFDVLLAQGPASVSELEIAQVYEHLRSKLPEYMIPSKIIPLEILPLTANGKIDRHALPHPMILSREHARNSRAAQTPTEKTLVQLWCETLELSNVGVEENFLELGGDSLLATKLLARIQTAFTIELPLRIVFEHPTIATLAEAIEQY